MGGWTPVVEPTAAWTPVNEGPPLTEAEAAARPPVPKPMVMKPSYTAMAIANSPSGADPHNPGNPNLNAIPESERTQVGTNALSTAIATTPLLEAGPLAELAESKLIPALEHAPLGVGRAVKAIQNAPNVAQKIFQGVASGGIYGGAEGLIHGNVVGDAAKGAAIGGTLGLVLPTLRGIAKSGPGVFRAPEAVQAAEDAASDVGKVAIPKTTGPTPPPKKLTLSPGEDLGLGMGNEHTITNPQGQRVGSAQIEMKPEGVAHVHWLGGDFSDYGRKDVMGAIKEAYPEAETITYDRRRLAKGADAATTTPRQMNVATAPSVDDVVNQATGNKPLAPNVPLKEQGATPKMEPPASNSGEQDPLKVKYPDPAQRQMVRANGERIVQAIGDDKDTMDAVHGLTRVDLRQALINDGVDMGQKTVSNSKFAGEGSITREDAFNKLLSKGHSPLDIVRMAKQVPQ